MSILDVAFFYASPYSICSLVVFSHVAAFSAHDGPGTEGQRFRGAQGEIGGAGRTRSGRGKGWKRYSNYPPVI